MPDTPIPPFKHRRLEKRTDELETNVGKLGGDVGRLTIRVDGLEDREDRPSETSFSFHPNRARMNFKNVNGWTIVAVIVAICGAIIVWLTHK